MMPVMDGYQLLEQLKSNNTTAHIPVVMLTARAEMQDKLKALRIGVDDYLLKPFEEEELLVRIENLLKNQSERLKALEHDNASEAPGPLLSQKDREWLESFESYLKARDGQASISVVSAKVGYADPRSFSRSFKKRFGKLPSQI